MWPSPHSSPVWCATNFITAAAPDSSGALFRYIIEKHPDIYDDGAWHNLDEMVERGSQLEVNPQYWATEEHLSDLQ